MRFNCGIVHPSPQTKVRIFRTCPKEMNHGFPKFKVIFCHTAHLEGSYTNLFYLTLWMMTEVLGYGLNASPISAWGDKLGPSTHGLSIYSSNTPNDPTADELR